MPARHANLLSSCGSAAVIEGTMAEDATPAPGAGTGVITEEQLRKAEAYVESEEGVANRLAGWAGVTVTTIAVVSSLFHLYAAYDIVPTQPLRYIHVAFVMVLSFLLFPIASRFRNQHSALGRRLRHRHRRHSRLRALRRRGLHRPRHLAGPRRCRVRRRLHPSPARGDAPRQRPDHARRRRAVHRLCHDRPLSAGALDPSRL